MEKITIDDTRKACLFCKKSVYDYPDCYYVEVCPYIRWDKEKMDKESGHVVEDLRSMGNDI